MILTHKEFENLLNFRFSEKMKQVIDSLKIELQPLSDEDFQQKVENIESVLSTPNIIAAGSHRIDDWNNGWDENNIEFAKSGNVDSLIPKYFGKYKTVRFDDKFYNILNKDCEINMLRVLQYFILEKYCNNFNNFYEFGCGTGHNLFAISEFEKDKNFFGFDWSNPPREIFQNIQKFYNRNFIFDNFDFEKPNHNVNIENNSVVFTFAALEQIGDRHDKFVQFLLEKKPSLCIHLEPISEILDNNEKLQSLSIRYINKRNYLSNFYSSLKKLQKDNRIDIIDVARTTIGSYFLEGYSLVVWRVK